MGDLRNKKEKNQNIQVFVRVRPISSREREIKSYSVVEAHGLRDIFVKHPPENKVTKKFTYDKVFGPASKQIDVYTSVVSPLIEEVLAGYSCTVFAYGQTGTGKTFTMAGENINGCGLSWQDDPMAGIIPRAVTQLFDELRVSALEYSIRVSYLELYNEELFDLLSPIDDNSKIRMYEDPAKKGSVIVHGLEEIPVQNKHEVYKIMERGQEKRKTAATLMNAQSSRSHTIFSILVHIKESSMEGEELLKAGKLNLVDLAGSENITKAGNDKKERARETVNINQSLLTLGRVITSLVERGPHIPYRESKLTRLLQDSLGGRTKTSIIATISPGHKDLDETLSTLEYAFRAKNIMNKPEINQRLAKTVVLKEYTAEIDRLRKDLAAHREKDGVHLANETYIEMTLKIEDQNKEIADKIMQIRAYKDEIEKQQDLYATVFSTLKDREMHLEKTTEALTTTRNTLNSTKQKLKHTMVVCDEKTHIIKKQMDTEVKLGSQVSELISVAELTTNDVSKLQDSLDMRRNVDEKIQTTAELFRSNVSSNMSVVCEELANFLASQTSHSQDIMDKLIKCDSEQADYKNKMLEMIEAANVEQVNVLTSNKDSLDSLQHDLNLCSEKDLEDHLKYVKVENEKLSDSRNNVLASLVQQLMSMFDKQRTSLSSYHQLISNQAAVNLQIVKEFSNMQKANLEQLGLQFNKQLEDQKCTLGNFSKLQEELLQMKEKNEMETKKKIDRLFKDLTSLSNGYNKETECTGSAFRVMKGHVDSLEQANVKMNDTITCNIRSGILKHEGHVEKMSSRNDLFINDVEKSATECDGTYIAECFIQFNSELNCVFNNVEEAFTEADNKRKKSHSNIVKRVQEEVDSSKESLDSGITALVKAKRDQIESVTQQHHSLDAAITEQKKLLEDGLQSLNVFHNETRSELQNLDHTVEKYLSEDLTLYAPTGQTPARKDYQFPKDMVATSPHNKIIKRFRQQMQTCKENQINVQNSSEGSSDDVELVEGTSTAPQLPLTTIDLNSTFPTMTNPEPHHSLFKASSEINILHVPIEVREKENGFRGCTRHEDTNIKSSLPVLQRLGSKIDVVNNKK